MLLQQLLTESTDRFEERFCNNHQKPIRFLRSIFYDEQDGAEEIENFLIEEIIIVFNRLNETTESK
jgi:hypothetical protein